MTQILKVKAAASLNVRAENIREGRKKNRIQLGSTKSSAVFISIYPVDNLLDKIVSYFAVKSGRFAKVKVKVNGKRVLLNVNSASNRLHLTKAQVRDTTNENYVMLLIQQAEATEKTLLNYQTIFKQHFSKKEVSPPDPLYRVNDKGLLECAEINASCLMNITRKGVNAKVGTGLNLEGKKIIVTHLTPSEVKFHFIEKQIAAGGTSTVHSLSKSKNEQYVYKKSLKEFTAAMKAEVKIVKELNANGPKDGIMLPIHLIKPLYVDSDEIGIFMPFYEQEYFDVCLEQFKSLSKSQLLVILKEFILLLSGVAYMHKVGIIHRDIKRENILCRKGRVDLTDFGSAINLKTCHEVSSCFITANCRYIKDQLSLNQLSSDDIESHTPLNKAMDVFSLGLVFFERLSKCKSPFTLDPEKGSKAFCHGEILSSRFPKYMPNELSTLIKAMIHPDWKLRITAEQALKVLNNYQVKLISE